MAPQEDQKLCNLNAQKTPCPNMSRSVGFLPFQGQPYPTTVKNGSSCKAMDTPNQRDLHDGWSHHRDEGHWLDFGFVLVTPDSIGMDKNGNIENPTRFSRHSFRTIDMEDDIPLFDQSIKFLLTSHLGDRFYLPMKRTDGDPFDALVF